MSRSQLELIEPVFRCVIDLHPVLVEVGQTGHVFANASHGPSKLSIMVGDPSNEPYMGADFKSIHLVSRQMKAGTLTDNCDADKNAFQVATRWHSFAIAQDEFVILTLLLRTRNALSTLRPLQHEQEENFHSTDRR